MTARDTTDRQELIKIVFRRAKPTEQSIYPSCGFDNPKGNLKGLIRLYIMALNLYFLFIKLCEKYNVGKPSVS